MYQNVKKAATAACGNGEIAPHKNQDYWFKFMIRVTENIKTDYMKMPRIEWRSFEACGHTLKYTSKALTFWI